MDGLFFYWLLWIFFVISFFFINDKVFREGLSIWLLTIIILSGRTLTLFSLEVSWTALFLLLSCYFFIGKQKRLDLLYLMISSFTMMLTFATFHLFALYDPVWLIFDMRFMLVFLLCYMAVILQKGFREQVVILISGVIHGDLFYGLFLKRFAVVHRVGDFFILDILTISCAALLVMAIFKHLSRTLENYFKQTKGEKEIT